MVTRKHGTDHPSKNYYSMEDLAEIASLDKKHLYARSTLSTLFVNVNSKSYPAKPHNFYRELRYASSCNKELCAIFNLLYRTPFEDLPLYLNDAETEFVVNWRLKNNK